MYYKKEQVLSFTTVEEGQDGDMEGKPFTQYCLNRECVFRSTCKRKTRKASLSSILFPPQQRSATQNP